MAAAGPWSVKGIDPKAREIAKDLARRSGLTLGDWLNQMIIEGGEPEPVPSPPQPRRPLDELYREAQSRRQQGGSSVVGEGEAARMTRALETLATRVEAGEHRATLAISGIDQSMMGVLTRLDELDREHVATGARLSNVLGEVRTAQAALAERLKRRDGGTSSVELEALKAGLDKLAERLDAAAAKADAEQEDARTTAGEMARRMERVETVMEAAPAAFADAEKVETVLTRMAERLDHSETKTDAALQTLQASFANLDARLRSGEARMAHVGGQDVERRFQALAQELTQRVDAARAELAQRLRGAVDGGRVERMDAALRELGGQMELAEKRSAQAIDSIGREVMRVAHKLGERMGAVEQAGAELVERTDARVAEIETRSAAAAETVAGEMTCAADAMEARLRDADTAQAQALEKLGGEIKRIAERLAERIAAADRRQADAMDEVTERVARIGSRIDERHDQASSELSERIRQSEARTAELLQDARTRLEPSSEPEPFVIASAPDTTPFAIEPVAAEPAPPPEASSPVSAYDRGFAGEDAAAPPHVALSNADPFAFDEDEPAQSHDVASAAESPPFSPAAEPEHAVSETEAGPFGRSSAFSAESPFDPDDDFAPSAPWRGPDVATASAAPVIAHDDFAASEPEERTTATPMEPDSEPFEPAFSSFSVSDFAPAASEPEPTGQTEQLSTRQMLEAARQAARRAAGGGKGDPDGSIAALPREPKTAGLRPFGLSFVGRRKKEAAPTLRTFVLASGIAGSLTAMGVGAYMIGGASHEGAPASSSELAMNGAAPLTAPTPAALAPTAAPNAAVALAPSMQPPAAAKVGDEPAKAPPKTAVYAKAAHDAMTEAASTPVKAEAAPRSPSALYASAVARLNSGDVGGLHELLTAADQGSAPAQFYLARLYDAGGAGLPKDVAQARRWTERAARGGDASAMYNLASYLYAGDGGPKDAAQAADWFRRSAEHGVVNGQYNLAQLYEKGYGVGQSDQDAYKWYLVAAGSGDAEARSAAAALKPKLSADAQSNAERAAAQVRASLSDGVKTAAASPPRS